jgi:hypothetical protein
MPLKNPTDRSIKIYSPNGKALVPWEQKKCIVFLLISPIVFLKKKILC